MLCSVVKGRTGWTEEEEEQRVMFCCERKDRVDRGGGAACYVAETMVYDRLLDIEDDKHQVVWIRMRPMKVPRKYSFIIIACIYHPVPSTTEYHLPPSTIYHPVPSTTHLAQTTVRCGNT